MSDEQPTVLVVDDEKDLCNVLTGLLGDFGYDCIGAHSGNQALQILAERNGDVDIVLSDIRMPDGDGVFLLKQIREKYPEISMFLMTGFSDYDVEQLVTDGAVEVFAKPMNLECLLDGFKKVLLG